MKIKIPVKSSSSNNNGDDPNLDLLPPALRMAATSSTRRPPPPAHRMQPSKTKSFQLRKDQVDALSKIRCQPREDMLTEDERRKQTLMRRSSVKAKREEEMREAKLHAESEAIMNAMKEEQEIVPTSVAAEEDANVPTVPAEPVSSSTSSRPPRMSWQRSSISPGVSPFSAKRTSVLQQQAQAMRAKVVALQLDNDEDEGDDVNAAAAADSKKPKHSLAIVQKKLEKVEKLLSQETTGSKEYKKLSKKRDQYRDELQEFETQRAQAKIDRQTAIARAEAAADEAERMARQAEQDEIRADQAREDASAAAAVRASALADEARLLQERAEALKVKRNSAVVVEKEKEEYDDDDDNELAKDTIVIMDEKERVKQERIEEYRKKQVEKKQEEDAAKLKAERNKEFKILKKKLQKLEGMIQDAQANGKDTTKMDKKKIEYSSQLQEFEEWQEEMGQAQREEAERQRDNAALEQEQRQTAEEEAERLRNAAEESRRESERLEKERAEEGERLRLERVKVEEEEEAKRIMEEERAAKDAEEAEELAVQQRMDAERRAADEAEEEKERLQEEEEEEARRIVEEERTAKESEEAKEVAAREAREAELRVAQDSREAEEAKRLRIERLEAERLEEEEEEARRIIEEERAIQEAEEAEELAIRDARETELRVAREAREAEEAKRLRIERLEAERLEEEEEEARRIIEEERAVQEAEEAEELAAREAREASSRAAREAREAEEAATRTTREAEEASERAAREAEMAVQRAEEERIDAERRQKEEEEQATRLEELRQETVTVEAQTASEEAPPAAAAAKTEASQDFLDLRNIPEPHSANTKKILSEIESVEERQSRLEKTLKQNGIAVSEDIPYEVAKDKIAQLQEQMKALAVSEEDQFIVQKKYYSLEEELSKYVTAMMLTDEFAEEQRMAEEKWEASIEIDNIAALKKFRSHMPVNIRNMTEEELTSNPTPNGKMLPAALAKKFKRTNILQLIRVDPRDLERMHPSLIEGLRSAGLTLTERRALHEHLKDVGAQWQQLQQDPSIERKFTWFMSLKSKFKEMVTAYDKHVQEFGPPSNHPYAKRNDPPGSGCTLIGNQCPVKADAATSYDDDYGFTQEAVYEGSSSTPSKSKSFETKAKDRRVSTSGAKAKDEALMAELRERLNLTESESDIDSKLLRELFFAEKRAASLEKQLTQNGLALPKEDISYAVAKAKVAEITEEIKVIASKMGSISDMKEMARLEKEYSQLSDDLEKYNNALMLTKEWALELLEKERQWEEGVRPDNQEALRKIRRHMPVNIKDLSEQDLIEGTTPNGNRLPQNIVRKFKRTNILQLVRMPPSMIEPMHPSSLEGMRSTGLTLTERRALHEHLKALGAKWKASSNDKMAERKWMWQESLRGKFKELVDKYQKHVDEFGPPGNHPYAKNRGDPGCPLLGKQCPLKADLEVDYSNDYGFPPEDVYNVEQVKKSNLLTVEDIERRKKEGDDWAYDAPAAPKEAEQRHPPIAGLMSAIGSRGAGGSAATTSDSLPKKGNGLIAALTKGGSGSDDKGASSKPPAPGGLLAAIQSKAGGDGGSSKPPAPGGLLAAIQSRGGDSAPEPSATPAPAPAKRMGGLLSAITGRKKS